MTPADHARATGIRLDELASDLRALAILTASLAVRGAHEALLADTRAATARACRAWDAACLAHVGRDQRRLPNWPRWAGVAWSQVEIAATIRTITDADAVDGLADECRRWAREHDAWQDGERAGAA